MKRALKWIGFVLGILAALILVVATIGYLLGSRQISRTYSITPEAIAVAPDAATVERGAHWYAVLCADCHGEDLGGKVFFDDPMLGTGIAPNLTTGEGGEAAEMSDDELAMAIRHGVNHEGAGIFAMPSEAFFHLSDEDLGSILAYLRHAPAVDKEWEPSRFTPLTRVLMGLGIFGNVYPAAIIDHDAVRAPAPPPGVTPEFGEYLVHVTGCAACHGAELSGGRSPDPAAPPGPNLTPGGHLAEWSESDFITTMQTGVEPDGEEMDAEFMPWEDLGQMSEDELRAVWLHLHSLPPLEDAVEEGE